MMTRIIGPGEGVVDLYAIALQEIVDVTAPENYLRPADPKIAAGWVANVKAALPRGYALVASTQLIGMFLMVAASPRIQPLVSSVSTATVGTGLMGYVGNKGGVGVRIVLGETTRVVFINCHLAAFQNGAERRNWDHAEIVRRMVFEKVKRDILAGYPEVGGLAAPVTEEKEGLEKADLVFWTGDLNYRVDLPNDEIRKAMEPYIPEEFPPTIPSEAPLSPTVASPARMLTFTFPPVSALPSIPTPYMTEGGLDLAVRTMLAQDQLYAQQTLEKAFKWYKEGKITFLPTYKYDVGTLGVWDSSEKKRAPAYCDRVLWKMKDEDGEGEGEWKHKKRPRPMSGDVTELMFETIDTGDDEENNKSPFTTPTLGKPLTRPRATTLTVEDEDGEDLIVTKSESVLPTAAEEEDRKVPIPDSFPQNATSSTSSVSDLKLNLITYTSHQFIRSSDHKPVSAVFSLTFPTVNEQLKSEVYAEVAKEVDRIENERRPVVTVIIDREGESPNPTRNVFHDEDHNVFLGEVRLARPVEKKVTIANTGLVPAKCMFNKRPIICEEFGDEEKEMICKGWLDVDFDDEFSDGGKAVTAGVTLQPGEVVDVYLNVLIDLDDVWLLQRLNGGSERLEDILVLHVEGGRDIFLPVSGIWAQSCFGRSLKELVTIPEGVGGARRYFAEDNELDPEPEEKKNEVKYSAPRELYRITEYLLHKVKDIVEDDISGLEDVEKEKWYVDPGWPFVKDTWGLKYDTDAESEDEVGGRGKRRKLLGYIVDRLDCDEEFEFEALAEREGFTAEDVIEVAAECLLGFLGLVKGRVVPEGLYGSVVKGGGVGGEKEIEKVWFAPQQLYSRYILVYV